MRHHTTSKQRVARLLAIACTITVAGCVHDPYNDAPQTRTETTDSADTRTTGQAPAEHRFRAGDDAPAPASVLPGGPDAKTADGLLRQFAEQYTNWDAKTLPDTRRRLAALAAEPFRAELLDAASELQDQMARNPTDNANMGRVEGILLAAGQPIFVLTRQTATFSESAQAHYTVYLVELTEVDGEWRVSEWRPVTA